MLISRTFIFLHPQKYGSLININSMYAIVDISGQQFKVEKNKKIYVHRLENQEGSTVSFDKVLLIDNDGKVLVGDPHVKGAAVNAKVVEHVKGDKVKVFKKKRRKGYQKMNGHRQLFTQIIIEDILEKAATTAKKESKPSDEKKEVKSSAKETAAPEKKEVKESKVDATKVAVADKKEDSESKAKSSSAKPKARKEEKAAETAPKKAEVKEEESKPAASKSAKKETKSDTKAPSKASADSTKKDAVKENKEEKSE